MKLVEALNYHKINLTAVSYGGVVTPVEAEVFDAMTTIQALLPTMTNAPETSLGLPLGDEKGQKKIIEWAYSQKVGYHGLITLPSGASGIFTRTKNGHSFLRIDPSQIQKEEANQIGMACHVLGLELHSAYKRTTFSVVNLAETVTSDMIEKHTNWVTRRMSR